MINSGLASDQILNENVKSSYGFIRITGKCYRVWFKH